MMTEVEVLYKTFVENSVEAILFAAPDGKVVNWNEGCRNFFGYSDEEIKQFSIQSLVDRSSSDTFSTMFDVVKKGRTLCFNVKCLTGRGNVVDTEITAGPLEKGDNPITYFVFKDNSNVDKIKSKIKNLKMFPESSPDFIFEWDRMKGITYYNQAVKDFFQEIGSKVDINRVLPDKTTPYCRRIAGTERIVEDIELRFENRIFSYSFIPYRTDPEKVLVIGKDDTVKKNLEDEIDSSYDRTKTILDFIESVLREFRYVELDDEIDLMPVANLFIRDVADQVTLSPSHLFIAFENSERLLEGPIIYKKHGELKTSPDNIVIHPRDLKKIVSDRGNVLFENWFDNNSDVRWFQDVFPESFSRIIPEIRNFVSYRISGEKNGVFIGFNYTKDVNEYDAETIKGLAIAISTIFSIQFQFRMKEEAQYSTMNKMAEYAEKRDMETGDHLKRMRNYARILSEELAKLPKYKGIIDREFIKKMYNSAPLHDIGKIGVAESILQKPGKLTDKEYEAMREHTIIGGKILEGPKFLEMAKDIAYYHHEKYDGSGYPYGIKGEEIPLSARIVALADVYDAMTSKRSYKEAFSHDRTKKLIAICSGGHFAPDVVDAFLAREQEFIRVKEMFKD